MSKIRREIMFHSSPGSLTHYLSPQLEGTGEGGLGQMTLKSLLLYDSTDHSLPGPPEAYHFQQVWGSEWSQWAYHGCLMVRDLWLIIEGGSAPHRQSGSFRSPELKDLRLSCWTPELCSTSYAHIQFQTLLLGLWVPRTPFASHAETSGKFL